MHTIHELSQSLCIAAGTGRTRFGVGSHTRREPSLRTLKISSEAARYALALAGPTRIGLGCMALTGVYGPVARSQAVATIHAARSNGVSLFDTAPLYGDGANEELLGKELANAGEVSIATKFGLYVGRNGKTFRNSGPSAVRQSVERSLRRLKRDRIDLLFQHRADSRIPEVEVAGVIEELIAEGKVKAFGLSSSSIGRTAEVGRHVRVRAVQNEYSLLKQPTVDTEPNAFATLGSTYIAHSPLGRGALTSDRPRVAMA